MEALAKLGIDIWGVVLYITGFGVLLAIMARFVYRPLLNKIDERRSVIEGNVNEAEKLRQKFHEETEKQRAEQDQYLQEARAKIKEAQSFARQSAKELIADADARREKIIAEAKNQAESMKDSVVDEAESEIKSKIEAVVLSVLENSVPETAVKKSINDALKELKS